jgi:iroE protein
MIEPKYRIKDKADFERIFKRAAELDNEELGDSFIVEGNHDITYGSIKATCELIGYDLLLLSQETVDDLERGKYSHIDTFYIDIVNLTMLDQNFKGTYSLFGGAIPDELDIDDDGTLRLWFD